MNKIAKIVNRKVTLLEMLTKNMKNWISFWDCCYAIWSTLNNQNCNPSSYPSSRSWDHWNVYSETTGPCRTIKSEFRWTNESSLTNWSSIIIYNVAVHESRLKGNVRKNRKWTIYYNGTNDCLFLWTFLPVGKSREFVLTRNNYFKIWLDGAVIWLVNRCHVSKQI